MSSKTAAKTKLKPGLSVVYATFNEEANLARSLESIKSLADEIIVVDGTSEDDTVKIAKQFGAKVISTTNKPIFHINKQMAMDAASYTWTLQMDADEVVDAEMQAHILRIVAGKEEAQAGYWLRRKNLFLSHFMTKGGQYPDPVIRFYQTGKAHLPMKTVHEQMEVDGEVGWLAGHLLHYSFPDFGVYLRKANAYTSLTAGEWLEAGRQPSVSMALEMWIVKPFWTFVMLFGRHKGFMDGFAGFVFAWFSALHFPIAYAKFWERFQAPTQKESEA